MEADKVIEWITHTWGVTLTWNQEQLIINHCRAREHGMVSTDPGREFARVLVDAYCEEMSHAEGSCGVGQRIGTPYDNGHSYTCDMGDGTHLVAHRGHGPSGVGCYPPVEDDYTSYCRCHNRTGLESHQHENDCPLATSTCVECLRNQSCGRHPGMKGISADYVQVIHDEVPLMETALTEETDG